MKDNAVVATAACRGRYSSGYAPSHSIHSRYAAVSTETQVCFLTISAAIPSIPVNQKTLRNRVLYAKTMWINWNLYDIKQIYNQFHE